MQCALGLKCQPQVWDFSSQYLHNLFLSTLNKVRSSWFWAPLYLLAMSAIGTSTPFFSNFHSVTTWRQIHSRQLSHHLLPLVIQCYWLMTRLESIVPPTAGFALLSDQYPDLIAVVVLTLPVSTSAWKSVLVSSAVRIFIFVSCCPRSIFSGNNFWPQILARLNVRSFDCTQPLVFTRTSNSLPRKHIKTMDISFHPRLLQEPVKFERHLLEDSFQNTADDHFLNIPVKVKHCHQLRDLENNRHKPWVWNPRNSSSLAARNIYPPYPLIIFWKLDMYTHAAIFASSLYSWTQWQNEQH